MSDIDAMVDTAPVAPTVDVAKDGTILDNNVEALVAEFRDLRDDLRAEGQRFKEYKANAELRMDAISMKLKEIAEALGVTALRTDAGTAYRQLKESYRVGDWDQILAYIKETNSWQCLEKRIGKLATQEIHRSTGQLPPGVEYVAEIEFVVRKNAD